MADVDPQEIEQLETDVHAMEWGDVSLEPEPGWEDIEKDLPEEWTQFLEQPELAHEYTQEEIAEFLDTEIDAPEGDIDQNAQDALQELDIDLDAIAQERDLDLAIDIDIEQDFDFGR